MSKVWECSQCRQMRSQGIVEGLGGEPEECETCGNDQFRLLSRSALSSLAEDPAEFVRHPRVRRRGLLAGSAVFLGWGGLWWTTGRPTVAETDQVAMKNSQFRPRNIQVDVGTEVTWSNEETADGEIEPPEYTIVSPSDEWDFEEDVPPGDSTSYTFEDPGEYAAYVPRVGNEDLEGMSMKIGVGQEISEPLGGW